MKLVRKDDPEVEVVGTYECLYAKAWCTPTGRNASGKITIDYDGGSDVWWDTQETILKRGKRLFVDANGEILPESQVELIEDEDA